MLQCLVSHPSRRVLSSRAGPGSPLDFIFHFFLLSSGMQFGQLTKNW